MPTILIIGKYRFFFNSREELRMHVHVSSSDATAKFWLEPIVGLSNSYNFSTKDLKEIQKIVEDKKMSLLSHGNNTLISDEVTSITKFGFWILIDKVEYFVPFSDYPDFKKARVEDILEFKKLSPTQLYWEKLDIDIELEALKNPRNYPLSFS